MDRLDRLTAARVDRLTAARVGRRIGPCTELTAALHRCVHYPDDSHRPLTGVLDAYL